MYGTRAIPLGPTTSAYRLAELEFVNKRNNVGAHCWLTWAGFLHHFTCGIRLDLIAQMAGFTRTSYAEHIYDQYFRHQIFDGLSYLEYCGWREQIQMIKGLPAYPPLQAFAHWVLDAGMEIAPVERAKNRSNTCSRSLIVNGKLCHLHVFALHDYRSIEASRLGNAFKLAVVKVVNNQPVRACLMPKAVLMDRGPQPSGRFRLDLNESDPRAISLPLPLLAA
jgi:hypothetical protein